MKIKDLILDMRKLREAATEEFNSMELAHQVRANLESKDRFSDEVALIADALDAAFIAAAPTNQARLEKALEIAVGFLESIESEDESMDLATSATLNEIEAALKGDS